MATRKSGPCQKVEVFSDGTGTFGCRGIDGSPITHCGKAPSYRDSALPLAEQLCQKAIAASEFSMSDPYKQRYVSVCDQLDETLADPYKAGSTDNLRLRFDAMERELESMITSPELTKGDNGRYLYHIDARTLHAFLPAFWHRAEHGVDSTMPDAIISDAHKKIIALLEDFDSLYKGVAVQVALRRTEIEIFALHLRTKRAEDFIYPTVFREDASETQSRNHDAYKIVEGRKVRVQVTNTDYISRRGRKKSTLYEPTTAVAIHQHVVNLDYREGETIVTKVSKMPVPIEHDHDVVSPYEEYDLDQHRFVAWGAVSHTDDLVLETYDGDYIQEFGGNRRDGLVQALVREAKGKKLSLGERNLLNSASHYLIALLREKEQM